jgi:hypothetical protein
MTSGRETDTRLPELGPLLGQLVAAPVEQASPLASLAVARLDLLSALFVRAGAARALLAQGDEPAARAALGKAAWLAVWEETVAEAGKGIIDECARRLRESARVSRYPAKRLASALPDAEARRMLAARLSAAGIGLEETTSLLDDDSRDWAEALRRVSGELQAAWDRLSDTATSELEHWERRAAEIRAWRRPWLPLLLVGTLLLALAIWLGLVLGGYLPAPGWLSPLTRWIWSL